MEKIFDLFHKRQISFSFKEDHSEIKCNLLQFVCRFSKYFPHDYVKNIVYSNSTKNIPKEKKITSLTITCNDSNSEYADKIVESADLNLQNKDGYSALMMAARYANTDSSEKTVEMLIDAGADVNLQNSDGLTALMMAARYANMDSSEKTVEMLIEAGADVNLQNSNGWAALMMAAKNANTDSSEKTVKMLIKAGADVNLQNGHGWTALMTASKRANEYSSEKTVKMLIKAGADLNLQTKWGYSAISLAAEYANTISSEKTVKMLIEAGANPTFLKDMDPLCHAIFSFVFSKYTLQKFLEKNKNAPIKMKQIAKHYFVMCKKNIISDVAKYMLKFY
jgi:ankyrin repeat protein